MKPAGPIFVLPANWSESPATWPRAPSLHVNGLGRAAHHDDPLGRNRSLDDRRHVVQQEAEQGFRGGSAVALGTANSDPGGPPTVFAFMNMAAALDPDGGLDEYVSGWLWLAVDVVAFAVFLVLGRGHRNLRSGSMLGLGFVLWGPTAFGAVHSAMDYSGMLAFNQNNWDIPPGTGWITVAVLLIAAAGSFWFGACRHAPRRVRVQKT